MNAPDEDPTRRYYVTVRDGGRCGFLLGPYATQREELDNVDRGRKLAQDGDATGRAWFYAYGTASLPAELPQPTTVFGA